MKSKGYLLDLAILDIGTSMLKITTNKIEEVTRTNDNKHHKTNNRIDRLIINLHDSLNGMYDHLSKDEQIKTNKIRHSVVTTLAKMKSSEPIDYEYFGAYLLYSNFYGKRNKPISQSILDRINKGKLFDLFEMVNSVVPDNGLGHKLAKDLLLRVR